jgi:ketosteroid isomerase-like protein
VTPRLVVAAFLDAFSRLDVAAMVAHLAPTASAFFPTEHERTRLEGREAIARAFAAATAQFRLQGATSIALDPQDVLVQEWEDTAVVTFQLHAEHLSRRTLVLRRDVGTWQIVHLHASNAAADR